MGNRASSLLWAVSVPAAAVLLALIYGPTFDLSYYGDDFSFVRSAPDLRLLDAFTGTHPNIGFYRPVDWIALEVCQRWMGLQTWPVHALSLILHLTLALATGFAATRWTGHALTGWIASLFVLVSQAAVHAVGSNDTLSQQVATTSGVLSLICVMHARRSSDHVVRHWGVAAGLYAAALVAKETSVSFLPILILAGACGSPKPERRSLVFSAVALVLVTGGYLWLRSYAGAPSAGVGPGRYGFSLSPLIAIRNASMLGFAVATPVSTVDLFFGLLNGRLLPLAVSTGTLGVLGVVVAWGSRRAGDGRRLLFLLALALLSMFPMIALNHVSELYAYNTLPFVGGILGLGLADSILTFRAPLVRRGLALGVLALLVANGFAARSKADGMVATAREAQRLLPGIQEAVLGLPPGGCLELRGPSAPGYSVFFQTGPRLFSSGEAGLARLAGRPDVRILTAPDVPEPPARTGCSVLELPAPVTEGFSRPLP
jgi:hypothetical protein